LLFKAVLGDHSCAFVYPGAVRTGGFSLIEVLIALGITVLFTAAAFATNAQLLKMLKANRETTASTMMLQERIEAFRSLAYSGVGSNIPSASPSPPTTAADVVKNVTVSEAQLGGISGSLSETITVSGYMDKTGHCPPTAAGQNQWVRNAGFPTGHAVTPVAGDLTTNYDLIRVDIQLSWISADGRIRNRTLAAVFGQGIIGE
jgi:type II secretory pathway pseudopilin PulG